MSTNIEWRGNQVSDEIARRLQGALNEINLRIEEKARRELVPGHGRLHGTLYRSIHTQAARREGDSLRGAIGSNVIYARRIHRLYFYIIIGLNAVKPQALDIVRDHARD